MFREHFYKALKLRQVSFQGYNGFMGALPF